MKVEIGKTYRARNGELVRVVKVDDMVHFVHVDGRPMTAAGWVKSYEVICCYPDGSQGYKEHEWDLVEEAVLFEVGKIYRGKDGIQRRVRAPFRKDEVLVEFVGHGFVTDDDGARYPFKPGDGDGARNKYTGRHYDNGRNYCGDLVPGEIDPCEAWWHQQIVQLQEQEFERDFPQLLVDAFSDAFSDALQAIGDEVVDLLAQLELESDFAAPEEPEPPRIEHADLIRALLDGKPMEMRYRPGHGDWVDVDDYQAALQILATRGSLWELRVKPERFVKWGFMYLDDVDQEVTVLGERDREGCAAQLAGVSRYGATHPTIVRLELEPQDGKLAIVKATTEAP